MLRKQESRFRERVDRGSMEAFKFCFDGKSFVPLPDGFFQGLEVEIAGLHIRSGFYNIARSTKENCMNSYISVNQDGLSNEDELLLSVLLKKVSHINT